MTKPPSPPYSTTDAPPPSYFEATASSSSSSSTANPPPLFPTQNPLSSFLRAAHTAHACHLAAHESTLLTLLTHSLDSHTSDLLASLSPPPRQLNLTLVPSAAVAPSWTLLDPDLDAEDPTRGRYFRAIRVQNKNNSKGPSSLGDGDKKSSSSASEEGETETVREKGFDEWGRWDDDDDDAGKKKKKKEEHWWFRDEVLACRLARYLLPPSPPSQPAAAAAAISRRGMRGIRDDYDHVRMTAKAEEVTFRRENEMGIWESLSGWGIVVRIKMRRA
ncbi:hypothetical protein SODALDRAFT_329287 [Sodiomyces alkalinus F11]|uniref:Uncharacterized protein n=1 Tax=Sodiomyces alkalinus (strain CBS 110278 / VKM F-3762 / F11) TaxID=1314773 RepID=A0A3N2PKQ5_SODAK|nr:hypothetical protein SODALDRAFT_329287 [Sodiomyces alkalinus F11]ROT35111.1 hypothetical protein SODALDRAFT_329287 [Sodiomyces alkalinus F11]